MDGGGDAMSEQVLEPHKTCPREDCRIEHLGGTSTLMGWSPTFDKHGNQIGSDPNIRISRSRCATCGAEWELRTQSDASSIKITKSRQDGEHLAAMLNELRSQRKGA